MFLSRLFVLAVIFLTSCFTALQAQQIQFSHQRGFYSQPFELVLETDPEFEIRYTRNGSVPTTESPLAGNAIHIVNRENEPNGISMISDISTAYAPWAPPMGNVFKATTIRAAAFRDGKQVGPVETHTYFVHPAGKERYSLTVMSLVTDSLHLFDHETGIYVLGKVFEDWKKANPFAPEAINTPGNYTQSGGDWERPVHIELFETDGSLGFAQDGGLRMQGSGARQFRHKSLRLYAKNDYGPSYFYYQLFPDKEMHRFKRFILRNSGQDFTKTMLRDGFMHRLVQDLSFDTQYYRPSIIFLNGEFWGILNIRDRFDDHYFETHYEVERDEIDFLELNSEVQEGSNTHYNAMISYFRNNSMANTAHYEHITTQMDVFNFGEYNMAQIYFNNRDWPHNNIEYWRKQTDRYEPDAPYGHDGRWRWILKDTDFGFGWNLGVDAWNYDMVGFALNPAGTENREWSTVILRSLVKNESFKTWFVTRYADLLNTHFRPERVLSVLNDVRQTIKPHIGEHINRWGYNDDRWRTPRNESEWEANLDLMRHFGEHRAAEIRKQLIKHFNLKNTYTLTVQLPNPSQGTITVNSIDLTPETHGVDFSRATWTGTYFQDMDLRLTATPAPGYVFAGWVGVSDINSDQITVNPRNNLRIDARFEVATNLGEEHPELPSQTQLLPNYPNPFNPTTTLQWQLAKAEHVTVTITDVTGRRVHTAFAGYQSAGKHQFTFDGSGLSTGVYLIHLRTSAGVLTQKMLLLK